MTNELTTADGTPVTVVIVPGLRDHVEDHWQTLLAAELDKVVTVPPVEVDGLSKAARVAALDSVLNSTEGPVLLVAHSAGCMITVHWSQQHDREVVGALLATPADLDQPLPAGYPPKHALDEGGWTPTPRAVLPFPTIVAASRDDPLGQFSRIAQLATDWDAHLVDLGSVGHLNPAAGYGPWPQAHDLIHEVLAQSASSDRTR